MITNGPAGPVSPVGTGAVLAARPLNGSVQWSARESGRKRAWDPGAPSPVRASREAGCGSVARGALTLELNGDAATGTHSSIVQRNQIDVSGICAGTGFSLRLCADAVLASSGRTGALGWPLRL